MRCLSGLFHRLSERVTLTLHKEPLASGDDDHDTMPSSGMLPEPVDQLIDHRRQDIIFQNCSRARTYTYMRCTYFMLVMLNILACHGIVFSLYRSQSFSYGGGGTFFFECRIARLSVECSRPVEAGWPLPHRLYCNNNLCISGLCQSRDRVSRDSKFGRIPLLHDAYTTVTFPVLLTGSVLRLSGHKYISAG